ncbi:hypothetical protein [Actibacterium lipolyticum]|nr:hypothetical protein [Actibacterium lipolyticum]
MRCDRYRADLAELDAQRRKATCDVGNIALSAGVDILWFQWAEKRRSALNKDLARALVEEEHARAKAKRAFGRNQALSKILGQSVHRR